MLPEYPIFQSTRPIRGATQEDYAVWFGGTDFNPRAPYGARPALPNMRPSAPRYFNPRAPYGARPDLCAQSGLNPPISIHAPHTGRDDRPIRPGGNAKYFNPRAPYGARRTDVQTVRKAVFISIHAPHTGRDDRQAQRLYARKDFNPRAPYGARLCSSLRKSIIRGFQSTRPIRGATTTTKAIPRVRGFQSTRPIRGATVHPSPEAPARIDISIHAPHTGRDSKNA